MVHTSSGSRMMPGWVVPISDRNGDAAHHGPTPAARPSLDGAGRGLAAVLLLAPLLAGLIPQAAAQTTPAVTINGGSPVTEGGYAIFTVRANPAPTASLNVNVNITDAAGSSDFLAGGNEGARTVTIAASQTLAYLHVLSEDDDVDETGGNVTASLRASSDYSLGTPSSGTVRVNDNDPPPTVTIEGGPAVTEGESAVFTVKANPAPADDLQVNLRVDDEGHFLPLFRSETKGGESKSVSNVHAIVTIPGGGNSVDYRAATTDDEYHEADGAVTMALRPGGGYSVGSPGKARVRVNDNDDPNIPIIDLSGSTIAPPITEGEDATFTIRANPAPTADLTIHFRVDQWHHNFLAEEDLGTKQHIIPAGESSVTYSVSTIDDATDEATGFVTLRLYSGDGYVVGRNRYQHSFVRDNDDPPGTSVITIKGGPAVTEGTDATFTFETNPAPTAALTVNFKVTDASGSGDFLAPESEGTKQVTIPAGTSSLSYSIPTVNDATSESDGKVTVTGESGSGYRFDQGTAAVEVNDDDPAVPVVVSNRNIVSVLRFIKPSGACCVEYRAREGEPIRVGLRLSSPLATDAVFTLVDKGYTRPSENLAPSAATSGTDYRSGPWKVTIPAGQTTAWVEIDTFDDNDVNEGSTEGQSALGFGRGSFPRYDMYEVFTLWVDETKLPAGVGVGSIWPIPAYGSNRHIRAAILDTDMPKISFESPSMVVDESAGTVDLMVKVDPPSKSPIHVEYRLSGTATRDGDDRDYRIVNELGRLGNNGLLRIPADQARVKMQVEIIDDDVEDTNETIRIEMTERKGLSNQYRGTSPYQDNRRISQFFSNQVAEPSSVSIVIRNDDGLPMVGIAPKTGTAASIPEGDSAAFTVTRSAAAATPLTVSVDVGEAPGSDFVATGDEGRRSVTIAANATSADFTVGTVDDDKDEPDGRVTATLAAGTDYAARPAPDDAASVAVTDNDDPPAEAQLSPASSPACAPPAAALVQEVRRYYELNRRRADRNHGENWRRVLIAFGAETHATLTPYTATEARASERIWSGWRPVRIELERLEACAAPVVAAAQPAEPAPPTPTVTLSAGAPITEGGAATFTLIATPAPTSDIDVSVILTETGRFAAPGATGPRTVTLGPSGTATLTVATDDDTTDEPDGAIAVTVTAGAGYTAGEAATARVAVADNDPTPLTVAVDDATAREGTEMAFTVRLSAPAPDLTIVYARTRETTPVSATEGVDYQPRSRISVAIFREGDTVQTLTVPTMHDAHDDGGETFELVLTRATPARHDAPFALSIADAVGVGTITNADPLPAAYLARFGRTVAEQALEGIARRLTAPRTPGVQGTLAGTALGAAPDAGPTFAARGLGAESPSPGAQDPDPLGDPFGFNRPPGHASTMTAREALLGSHFSLTGARDATGGSLAAWGRASAHHFDGAARGDGTAITLDATVTTALIGADYARDDWLLGLALTHSTSEGDYASLGDNPCAPPPTSVLCDAAVRAGTGTLDASLTAAVPYAALEATPRLKLWGAAGLGTGEVTVKTQDRHYRADTEWTMAAAGARSALLDAPPATTGPTLALTADALWTRTASERTAALAASDSDVTRLRLGLEGSWHIAMADATRLVPTLALGARHDGGDAETGAGVELGAGLAWSAPALGLSLDLSGRTLIAHEDDDLEDRGVSAALAFDPDPATERGAAFSVRQDVGGPAEGGLEALFTPAPLADRPGREARAHWTLEAAYGLPALGGRFTASPHAAVGLAPDTRDYTLGWRLTPHAATAPDLTVGLRATRHEPASTPPVHTLGVEATVRW